MGSHVYRNHGIVRKLQSFTVTRTRQAFFEYHWTHEGCGCIVRKTKRGWECPTCGIVAADLYTEVVGRCEEN